jgi:hypothetical protein
MQTEISQSRATQLSRYNNPKDIYKYLNQTNESLVVFRASLTKTLSLEDVSRSYNDINNLRFRPSDVADLDANRNTSK